MCPYLISFSIGVILFFQAVGEGHFRHAGLDKLLTTRGATLRIMESGKEAGHEAKNSLGILEKR